MDPTSNHDIPLYVVGLPVNEPNFKLITKKFNNVLKRVQKGISNIHEARIAVKTLNIKGNRQTYEVSILIKTQRKRFSYKETGWDISKICESVGQKLLREMTKNKTNKRQKQSIRKIKEKIF